MAAMEIIFGKIIAEPISLTNMKIIPSINAETAIPKIGPEIKKSNISRKLLNRTTFLKTPKISKTLIIKIENIKLRKKIA